MIQELTRASKRPSHEVSTASRTTRATLLACALATLLASPISARMKEHQFKTMAECDRLKDNRHGCLKAMNGQVHRSAEGKLVVCRVDDMQADKPTYQCKPVPIPANLKPWQREIVEQAKPIKLLFNERATDLVWHNYGLALDSRAQLARWGDLAGRAAACGEDILDFAQRVDTAIDRNLGNADGLLAFRGFFRRNLLVALYRYLPDPREKSDALIARMQHELSYRLYRRFIPDGSLGVAWAEHEFYRKAHLPVFNNELDCPAVKALFAETLKRLPPPFIVTEPPHSFAQWQRYAEQIYPAVLCSIDVTDAMFRMRRWMMQTPPSRELSHLYALENTAVLPYEVEEKGTRPRDCQGAALEFLRVKFPGSPGAEEWLRRYPAPWGPGRQRRDDYLKEIGRIDHWAKTAAKALWCDQDAQVREFIVAAEHWIDQRMAQKDAKEHTARRLRDKMDRAWMDVEPEGWPLVAPGNPNRNASQRAERMHEVKFKPLYHFGPLTERLDVRSGEYRLRLFGVRRKEDLTDPPIKLPQDCPGVAKELAAVLKEANTPTEPPETLLEHHIAYTGTPRVCTPPRDQHCTFGKGKEECRPWVNYRDNGDGTVSGNMRYADVRHPMWKRCSEGLSGARCERGKARLFTPSQAQAYIKQHSFAGYSDWRLPEKVRLGELLQRNCHNPSIDLEYFPNTPAGLFLTNAEAPYNMLNYVDFYGGAGYGVVSEEERYYLRLMRDER